MIAGKAEIWLKLTLILAITFSLFIVISVPEHFLKEHLWDHLVKRHLLKIFLWTFGTLLAVHFLLHFIDVQSWLSNNLLIMLLLAVFIGMIPFSILLASSISKDGHGSLPLLAESKRGFLYVKSVNMLVALVAGCNSRSIRCCKKLIT